MKRTAPWPQLLTVAALIVVVPLGACTGNADPPVALPSAAAPASTSASPSASPSASAAAESPEQARQRVIDAYVGMQNAFLKASELGDPAYPELPKFADGAALTTLTDGLKASKAKGLLGRGQAVYHPEVQALAPPNSPTRASLRDCMDTSKTSQYKANGDAYQDSPGGLRLVLADVERVGGVWKVTSFGVRGVGSCTV
jgi:hypothetical protein